MLLKKYEIKACFIFPSHLTNASALPGKTRKHKIECFTQMLHYMLCKTIQSLLDFFNLYDSQHCC